MLEELIYCGRQEVWAQKQRAALNALTPQVRPNECEVGAWPYITHLKA